MKIKEIIEKINYRYVSFLIMVIYFSIEVVSAQIVDQAKDALPKINFANMSSVIAIFFISIIVCIVVGVGVYILIRELKFNRTVTIWEDVEGHDDLEPVGKDKAMVVKVGQGGTELLYLKKRKTYKGAYGKRISKKAHFFVIGKDGYWYNSTLGSLEHGLRKINIKPTAVNMRYQNESLMELIKDRYDKQGWWAQYGQLIVNIVFFILVALMFWLYFNAFKETAPALTGAAEALKEGAEVFRSGVAGLDNLGQGGSGFTQA